MKAYIFIILALLSLSGCASMGSFLEAWGEHPRLVKDPATNGFVVVGGDAKLSEGSKLVPDGQGGFYILEP